MGEAPLMVSVSGIRGVVGKSLTPELATRFAMCFGSELTGQRVAVSRDGRATGEVYRHAVIAGLLAVGCEVVDLGIAMTPTCGYYVKSTGAGGAIQITASHNPPEYNGLKLFRPEGFVLSPEAGRRVADAYHQGRFTLVTHERIAGVWSEPDPHRLHLEAVLPLVNAGAIRRASFKVVFDGCHGSGLMLGPQLLDQLGCQVEVLGSPADGHFDHPPEPTEANLTSLSAAVKKHGADLGFAVDPDADRLAIVDNTGRYIGEEYTLALAIMHRLSQKTGPVVLNGSTSRLSEWVAKQKGCPVHRTKVGEVHVAERILAENAVIGGEGNGGVIDPRVVLGRDSAIAMALVLDLLAERQTPLQQIVDGLPRFVIQKDKFEVDQTRLPAVFAAVEKQFSDGAIDRQDGLRIEWPDAWVQVRASNTEPIIRVFAESESADRARALCDAVGGLVNA